MAGSNRSTVQPTGPAPRGKTQWEGEAQARGAQPQGTYGAADDPMMQWATQGPAPTGQPPTGYPAPAPRFAQQGQPQHHYPEFGAPQHPQAAQHDYGHHDPHAQPQLQGYPDPHAPARGQHVPFDRYGQPHAPQADPHAIPGQNWRGAEPQSYDAGYRQPAAGPYPGASHGETHGYDLSQYSPPGQPTAQRHQMPAAPAAAAGYPAGQDPYNRAAGYPNGPTDYQAYQQHAGQHGQQSGEPYNLDQYAHPAAHQGYAEQQSYDQQQGYSADGQHYEDPEAAYEEEVEEAAPSRGPRAMLVAGALIGAIAVGGGLAYGYRMLGGKDSGKPPVVKADQSPAKMKPADPGGKDVAHTDKKFLNRLTEGGGATGGSSSPGAPPAAGQAAEPEAPRKVTTLVVNKDGTLTPQVAPPPVSIAPPPSGVPGMVVEGLTPRPPLRGSNDGPAPIATAPPVINAAPPPPAAPRVADLPLPRVRGDAAAPAAGPAPTTPVKKRPAVRDDALAPQQPQAKAAVATAPATTGTVVGYVPVLASKKSREDALKSFADLHQKYPDLLSGRSPDVMEANIPEKGTYYRLIVGPPGSKEAARDLCTKLQAQGFKDCWATGYRQ